MESFLWANRKLDLKAQAVVLTRWPAAVKQTLPHLMLDPAISLHEGDVRTFTFPSGQFSHVIHAATDSSAKLNSENPLLMLDTIVDGTRRTLEFASHCKAQNFLLTSSGAVYGKQPPEITQIPEEYTGAPDPFDPRSAYGQGKRLAEHLCTLYASPALEIKIARGFAFVGPYLPLDIHLAIGNFIRDGLNGGPIIVKGDGTPRRSYLYAADLAIWLWTILLCGESLRPYNVGSDESLSIAEVARQVARCFSPEMKVKIHGKTNPARSVERYVPDTKRAKQELGLTPLVSVDMGILKTIQYQRGEYASSK